MRRIGLTWAALACAAALLRPDAPAADDRWIVSELPSLPESVSTDPRAVNAAGQVAGTAIFHPPKNAGNHAVLWKKEGPQDLGTLGGPASHGLGINDAGHVVGFSSVGGGPKPAIRAFLWVDGKRTDLGALPGGSNSRAADINNAGEIAGDADAPGAGARAVAWRNGRLRELPTLGGLSCAAFAINNKGAIAGEAQLPGNRALHAVLWEDGSIKDLGTLGGQFSTAQDLNDEGAVVGYSAISAESNRMHAFVYEAGRMTDLGTLPSANNSYALGINRRGEIVGQAELPGGTGLRAVIWLDDKLRDLNSLIPSDSGWTLLSARAINDGGIIVGTGLLKGEPRAYILRRP
jgi:probable HAF family extracellular repeat protein